MKTKIIPLALLAVGLLVTTINAQAAVDVASTIEVGIQASTSEGATGSGRASTQSSTTVKSESKTETSGSNLLNISIDADEIRANTDIDLSILSAVQVASDSDLKAYANVVAYQDASVRSISTADNKVTVSFKRPAKLFGFLSVNVKERAQVTIDEKGKQSVKVSKSWWAFMAADDLQSDTFSSNLESKLSARGTLTTNATLSSKAKAEIISDIEASSNAVYGAKTN